MKKILMITIIAILMVNVAFASNYVDQFLGIKYDYDKSPESREVLFTEDMCNGQSLFNSHVKEINNIPAFKEVIEIFDDGYHVVYLDRYEWQDTKHFTIIKQDDEIKAIRKGLCVGDEDYRMYTISLDLEETKEKFETPGVDYFVESYNVLKNIDGINLIEKLHILKIAAKYGLADMRVLLKNG